MNQNMTVSKDSEKLTVVGSDPQYSVFVVKGQDYLRDKDGFVRRFWTFQAADDEISRYGKDAYVCPAPEFT